MGRRILTNRLFVGDERFAALVALTGEKLPELGRTLKVRLDLSQRSLNLLVTEKFLPELGNLPELPHFGGSEPEAHAHRLDRFLDLGGSQPEVVGRGVDRAPGGDRLLGVGDLGRLDGGIRRGGRALLHVGSDLGLLHRLLARRGVVRGHGVRDGETDDDERDHPDETESPHWETLLKKLSSTEENK